MKRDSGFKFSGFNSGFTWESAAEKKSGAKQRKSKLEPLRASLRILVEKANAAISQLNDAGLLEKSLAYQEAMRSAPARAESLFGVEDKKRFRELKREASRLQAFLSSPEIQPHIVNYNEKANAAISKYNLSFANQHEAFMRTGNRFDVEDQDRMKLALRIFRDIASTEPAVIGKEAYGSDNLINLIYDELEGYDPDDSEDNINEKIATAHNVAFWALEEYKHNTRWGFVPKSDSTGDMGIVEQIKKAQDADEFFKNNPLIRPNNF